MLHLPRLELLLFMMVLPMIVAAGATLLRAAGAGYVAAGVLFAVLLPAAFLGISLVFIVRYLLRHSVERRRAVFVLALPPRVAPADAGSPQAPAPGSPVRTRGQRAAAAGLARDSGSLTQQFLASPAGTARTTDGLLSPGESLQSMDLSPSSPPSAAQVISSGGSAPASPAGEGAAQAATPRRQRSEVASPASSAFATPPSHPASPAEPAEGAVHAPAASGGRGLLGGAWRAFQRWFMRPIFGFELGGNGGAAGGPQAARAAAQQSSAAIAVGTAADAGALAGQGAWLCKDKWDTAFVKRYGSLFEDARGPQVYHITSAYDAAADAAGERPPACEGCSGAGRWAVRAGRLPAAGCCRCC